MNIYIIYRKSQENLGSVKMRVFQMKDLLQSKGFCINTIGIYASKILLPHYYWSYSIKRNSIIIFNKDAIDRAPKNILKLLRKRNIKIGLDALDKDLNRFDYDKVDFLIASSNRQYHFFKNIIKSKNPEIKVLELPHQADLGLKTDHIDPDFTIRKNKKIFYFGEHTNIYIPTKYLDKIDILPYDGNMNNSEINLMKDYEFQYCIRGPQQNTSLYIFKPITKIVNSYYLGALPIISFDMEDAVKALGIDYPFTLQSYSEDGFASLFERIKLRSDDDINIAIKGLKNLEKSHGFDAVCNSFSRVIRKIDKPC